MKATKENIETAVEETRGYFKVYGSGRDKWSGKPFISLVGNKVQLQAFCKLHGLTAVFQDASIFDSTNAFATIELED